MSRIHPECFDSDPSDRSAADVLVREEPAEEEDEEEDEGDGKDGDEDDEEDDGYSEMSQARRRLRSINAQEEGLKQDKYGEKVRFRLINLWFHDPVSKVKPPVTQAMRP